MSQYLTGLNLLNPAVKRYDGGTSSFTMDANGTTNGTLLWVSGVAQIPGTDYNVSGATITTTTAAPAGTNTVVSLQLFETGIVNTVASNAVTTVKINDDAVTLAKMASGTDGNIISYDTSGNPVAVATGTDGQVLTSSGAGAVCAFEDATGGMVFIQSQTASSAASIDFDAQLSSTYDQYFLVGTDLHLDTNGVQLWARTDSNSGDSFDSSSGDYCWQNGGTTFASSVAAHSGADTKIIICGNNSGTAWGNDADTCGLLYMYINNPSGTTFKKNITGIISYPDDDDSATGQHSTIQFSGQREATAAIDSIQLLASSGTIDGTVRLYGIIDS